MRRSALPFAGALAGILITACAPTTDSVETEPAGEAIAGTESDMAAQLQDAEPIDYEGVPFDPMEAVPVSEGEAAPDALVETVDGATVNLSEVLGDEPTVLVFYRGGWCPYCTRHLAELGQRKEDLRELGFQMVGVSMDRPEKLEESTESLDLDYVLLSDSRAFATMAYGLAFRMNPEDVAMYRNEYGIDLEDASGQTHHILPVPAVYLVDGAGRIRYAYTNPDYKVRLDGDTLLSEAQAVAESS